MKPLKRHTALIGLSREHHHALSLCVRLLRTPSESHQTELEQHFPELETHFSEEETLFAGYWRHIAPELKTRFDQDHAKLRRMMAAPVYTDAEWNTDFAVTLRDHARFEERELFPAIETLMPSEAAI